VAGGDPEQANLPRGVIHGQQPNRLLEGQRPGGNLGPDEQPKGMRLRRVECYAELACVRVEAPQRDQGGTLAGVRRHSGLGRVNHVGDGCSGGHVYDQLAQFALRGPDGEVMRPFDHTGGGGVEL
jgi:hypothetical protein